MDDHTCHSCKTNTAITVIIWTGQTSNPLIKSSYCVLYVRWVDFKFPDSSTWHIHSDEESLLTVSLITALVIAESAQAVGEDTRFSPSWSQHTWPERSQTQIQFTASPASLNGLSLFGSVIKANTLWYKIRLWPTVTHACSNKTNVHGPTTPERLCESTNNKYHVDIQVL